MSVLLGVIIWGIVDLLCIKKYGSPSLSILITKCYYSDHFKWLSYSLWGDDSWYYSRVYIKMNKPTNEG